MIGPVRMAHHPNLNDFTWKKAKQTISITAQYEVVNTKDFKVKLMMHFELVAQDLHPLFDVQANSGIATALIFVTAVL